MTTGNWRLATGNLFVMACLLAPCAHAEGDKADAKPRPVLAIWDSGAPSATPVASAALTAHEGWTQIASGENPASFKGDAIVTNGLVAAVLRKQSAALELF